MCTGERRRYRRKIQTEDEDMEDMKTQPGYERQALGVKGNGAEKRIRTRAGTCNASPHRSDFL